jgi:hypothetical protein
MLRRGPISLSSKHGRVIPRVRSKKKIEVVVSVSVVVRWLLACCLLCADRSFDLIASQPGKGNHVRKRNRRVHPCPHTNPAIVANKKTPVLGRFL